MQLLNGLRGAAAVTSRGSTVLREAGGPIDVADGRPCQVDTRFQIASISKQFAAVAVLLLAERGALTLDQTVDRWLPDSPAAWRSMTVHHLLTQTSGIGHWGEVPGFDVFEPMEIDHRLALIEQAPLHTPPGRRWAYSSPGYLVIGQIVQQAAGQAYADFLTEQIFAPLDMTSTTAGRTPPGANVARGHHGDRSVPLVDLAAMAGTGDIWSTVSDLARYTAALHTGTLLSGDSRQALLTRHTPLDEPTQGDGALVRDGYAYGLFTGTIAGRPAYFHPGDNPGYQSFLAWLPDHETTLVILSNDETTNIEQVLGQMIVHA